MPVKKKKNTSESSGGKFLVIVESPAKSKTINKILGSDYKVLASMGHLVDLPHNKMGIDFENDFKPEYHIMKGRKKQLLSLKSEAKEARGVYLAADPDREGEAICWHIKRELEKVNDNISRVSFEEITERAVKEAFKHPHPIDMLKVDAQQARRILDRIVGYSLSPLLWKKITRGLSAGRVQSVAVKLIVQREDAIRGFTAQEYWTIDALLNKKEEKPANLFKAKLVKYKGEKIHIPDKSSADNIMSSLEKEKYVVGDVIRKEKKSYPRAPYITSMLQQDAFNKLSFSAAKTMRIAQGLYEGIELGGEGSVGLITYMRTDSVRISDDALKQVREYIVNKYGKDYCPAKPNEYKSRKRAQEAHEAIRPTLPLRSPEEVKEFLSPDEFKLYDLIWRRFIASQMKEALYSVLAVNIDAGDYRFHAGGGKLLFDGFLRLHQSASANDEIMMELPVLEKGEEIYLKKLLSEQHFTKPPARYTDASLVKDLEEKGIGRPSTYAPIIKTIIARNYVKRMGRSLYPTELGELVNKLLIDSFPDIVNDEFTARMEDELDRIEEGSIERVNVLRGFYDSFVKTLDEAKIKMASVKREIIETKELCEKCGKPMVIKWGRRGRFLSCSAFPACKNAKSITTGIKCPTEACGGELVERRSKRGAFYGCTNYPKCTYTTRKLPGTDEVQDEDVSNETVY